MASFEVLDHTADTGIRVEGRSLCELIESAANGMFGLMAEDNRCPSERPIEFDMSSRSADDLVIDTLSELLYQSETQDLLLCEIEVGEAEDGGVTVTTWGVPWDHVELTGPPIKAVTYHDFEVKREGDSWTATVYFDV